MFFPWTSHRGSACISPTSFFYPELNFRVSASSRGCVKQLCRRRCIVEEERKHTVEWEVVSVAQAGSSNATSREPSAFWAAAGFDSRLRGRIEKYSRCVIRGVLSRPNQIQVNTSVRFTNPPPPPRKSACLCFMSVSFFSVWVFV